MKIESTIEIACSPEEVFKWIDDPDKAKMWQKDVKSEEILFKTPEKIGTTFKEEIEEDGNRLIIHGEIKDYIQNQLISFHLNSKIHTVYVTYSLDGKSKLTKVMVDSIINWKFPMSIISLVVGNRIRSNISQKIRSELQKLKALCES